MIPDTLPNAVCWDLTQAPFNADPTGKTDSTEAIIAAMNVVTSLSLAALGETLQELVAMPGLTGYHPAGFENRKANGNLTAIFPAYIPYAPTLYLPAGEYLVSDTLLYEHKRLINSPGSEMNMQIRLRGAGRDQTTIRLADNAPGFQGNEPKPVVSVMGGERTNIAMSNYVEDLTIDTGKGNPAAVGLDFYANNSGAVRHVTIRGDGSAARGLMLGHSNYSGILLKHIDIAGFQTGLHIQSRTATMYMTGEHINIRDCAVGVFSGRPSASLRKITVSGAETGVVIDGAGGLLVLIDSEISGHGPRAIERRDGMFYASNVQINGFADAADIEEVLDGAQSLGSGAVVPRLPVEETPDVPASDHRCAPEDFGAVADGQTDAAPALQRALDSGAAEVHFGPGKYLLDAPVKIPASVTRINFHFADIVAGPNLRKLAGQGAFVVAEDAATPLVIEDILAWEQWSGAHITIDHASTRTLVLSDLHTQTLPLYFNSVPGGKVFIDNAACTAGVIPGQKGHDRVCLHFKGQQVWARQVNPERGEPMAINDGGALWVLGFKTEDDATAFHTINGGTTEVLGGVLNCGGHRHPSFLSEDSAMRVICTSNGWAHHNIIRTAVKEVRNGRETLVLAADLPDRGLEEYRGPQFIVPLYATPLQSAVLAGAGA